MKKILILFAAAISVEQAAAQKGGDFTMSYPISLPMGNLKDFVSETSFRGFNIEFNKTQKPNLDVGFELGWNVFYSRKDDNVYSKETASISGVQYRYTNTVPMLIGAKFYKPNAKGISPYVGVGTGTVYVDRTTDFGLYRVSTTAWQFCIRPELGVKIHGDKGVAGILGLKYYGAFGTSELDGQSYLSLNIGIVFSSL